MQQQRRMLGKKKKKKKKKERIHTLSSMIVTGMLRMEMMKSLRQMLIGN
jgi:hypothetical protein